MSGEFCRDLMKPARIVAKSRPSFRGLSHFPPLFPQQSNKEKRSDYKAAFRILPSPPPLPRPEKLSPEISTPDLNPITTSLLEFGHKRNRHQRTQYNTALHIFSPPPFSQILSSSFVLCAPRQQLKQFERTF